MRAGLPVVASDVGGNREAVTMGRTGLLVPAGDVAALASHLASVIVNPELRKRLGDHGRDRYLAHFTFDRMLAKTLRVYQEVAAAASAAGEGRVSEAGGGSGGKHRGAVISFDGLSGGPGR
jgi:glycosyltransferase involved in cell wall biosynthesis